MADSRLHICSHSFLHHTSLLLKHKLCSCYGLDYTTSTSMGHTFRHEFHHWSMSLTFTELSAIQNDINKLRDSGDCFHAVIFLAQHEPACTKIGVGKDVPLGHTAMMPLYLCSINRKKLGQTSMHSQHTEPRMHC